MPKPKFKPGQRVWFLKSMRMCVVKSINADGTYVVEVMDSGKELLATEDGLELCEGQG